jgi:hypothetical protein
MSGAADVIRSHISEIERLMRSGTSICMHLYII